MDGASPRAALSLAAMGTLLDDLDAFLQEHRRCGKMDGGFDGVRIWMTCDCGALLAREPEGPAAHASDAI